MGGCISALLHRVFRGGFTAKYNIGRKLGQGAYGFVYQCTRNGTKEEYAVKILEVASDAEVMNHARNEKRICSLLQHDNIVFYHEAFFERRCSYIVFELIRGERLLREIGTRKHYCERDAVDYMYQILNAVEYCHSKNIIHRDLKPANIMLRVHDDCVKLIDFGLALKTRERNTPNYYGYYGTSGYMAPEIANGHRYGKPVDIWACGVLFYNLLMGIHSFNVSDEYMFRQLMADDERAFRFRLFKGVTGDAIALILYMVEIDQARRPTASNAKRQLERLSDRTNEEITINLPQTIFHLRRW